MIHSAKGAVVRRCARRKERRLLETELYYEWLHELEYVVCAFEVRICLVRDAMRCAHCKS